MVVVTLHEVLDSFLNLLVECDADGVSVETRLKTFNAKQIRVPYVDDEIGIQEGEYDEVLEFMTEEDLSFFIMKYSNK